MQLISDESRQRVRVVLDVENFSPRYKTENGIYTFTSPSLWTLEKNYFYLLKNSTVIPFDQKYLYKPSYLSYSVYETIALEYVLMYVNNVFCTEDFNLTSVIIPSLSSIIDICQDKFSKQPVDNLEVVSW
jgi:hypothetical protein